MEMDQDVVMEPVQPVQPKDVDHDMLSPVSKLELAHKYAALEQQRRIETASARVVEAKKQNTFKRKELEARLESHIKKKIHKTISDPKPVQEDEEYDDEEGPQVTVNLLEEFDSEDSDIVMQENNHNNYTQNPYVKSPVVQKTSTTFDPDSYLSLDGIADVSSLELIEGDEITRTLLRARERLSELSSNSLNIPRRSYEDFMSSDIIQNSNSNSNTLVEHDTSSLLDKKSPFDKPRTNYHLKHLGYTEKINIYAPISEQKVNLQQVLHEPRPVTVKSESDIEDEEDSDYVPEDGSDDESDSDFSSCESESNDENSDLETELIPSKGKTSSHRSSSLLSMAFWMPVYFLSFCILLLAFVITIDLSEDKYHFCELLTKASDVLEAGSNERILSCGTLMKLQENVQTWWNELRE